ncbi:MAG TPA: hypothetical protein VGK50_00280 [Coriobacteriia bacterium]|jgi:uncharacterized protein YoxC
MSIGWPLAVVAVAIVIGIVAVLSTVLAARGAVATEEAKGKYGEQYRMLAADYEKLAKETRDVQAAMRTDLDDLRAKVESIEKMMREVG